MLRVRFLLRLYLAYAAVLALSTILVWVICSRWFVDEARDEITRSLEAQARLIQEAALPVLEGGDQTGFQQRIAELGAEVGTRFTIIRVDGTVIADSDESPSSMGNHRDRPEVIGALENGVAAYSRFSDTIGTEMMYAALDVQSDGKSCGIVRAGIRLNAVDIRLGRLRNALLIAAVGATLLSLAVGYVFARRVTVPISEMTRAAERVAAGGSAGMAITQARRDEIGDLSRALASMETRLHDRLELLQVERHKLAAVLAGMVEGVVAVDDEQRILHVNEAAARMLSVEVRDYAGGSLFDLTRVPKVSDTVATVLRTGTNAQDEVHLPGSPPRILQLHASPLRDVGNQVTGSVVVLHEVTELRRLETVRRDFVANVSHELKTPLAAIRGILETVDEDPQMPDEIRVNFLSKVRRQSQRLSALVSDLLVLSRIESDHALDQRDIHDLRDVVGDSVTKYADDVSGQGLTLETDISEHPVQVLSDEETLREIVDNLLTNAVRYTPSGGQLWLRVRSESGSAVFEMEDTGIGIEPSEQDRIFERFYTVDKARSREKGGTGLGLAIVKHATESMGGQIFLESQPGRGSTFRVRIPLAPERRCGV